MNTKKHAHGFRTRRVTALALTFALLFGMATTATAASPSGEEQQDYTGATMRNVMYYGDWSIWGGQGNFYPSGIPADQLTHLNFAFLDFDGSGNLVFTDKDAATGAPVGMPGAQWGAANSGILSAMQDLRAENPNLRIGISLGGWSKSGDFSTVSANAATRKTFVQNVMKFIRYTNMDFVDLDWEYPGEYRDPDLVDNKNDEGTTHATDADKENYILLLQEFRTQLDKQGAELGKKYELTVALPAPKAKLDLGIDIPKLFSLVDFANIMTYDMRGAWDETSGHQTGLYTNPNDPLKDAGLSVDASVQYLLSKGAPAQKVVIGCAFYSRGWQKVSAGPDASTPGLYGDAEVCTLDADQSASRGATNEAPLKDGEGGRRGGVWSYRSFAQMKGSSAGLKEYWDDVAKAPYMYDSASGTFYTYDNQRSIKEKAAYVKANKLGGIISWMASEDAPTNSNKRDELTKTIKEALFGSAPLTQYNVVTTPADVTMKVSPYTEEWTGAKGFEISLKNNAVKNESNEVLSLVELANETIKAPKLYITTKSGANFASGGYGSGNIVNGPGNVTSIDLTSVYDGKTIAQGYTYTFKITTTGAADLSDIVKIELAQRIIEGGAEISRQVVYGGGGEPENAAPVLSGVRDQTITVGDSLSALAGVSAFDKEDGDLTSGVKVSGTVDTAKAGSYTLTYTVADSKGATATAKAVITVKAKEEPQNTAPVLSGVKDQTITVGDSFHALAGVTASDKEDGSLTAAIQVIGTVDTSKAGSYTLTYSVTDSKGATTTAKAVVTVKGKDDPQPENTAPVLSGVKDQTITVGDSFNALAGVTASDKEDGDLTASIKVSGTVDTAKAGSYTLTYSVTDSNGAAATAKATVTVQAKDTPDPSVQEWKPLTNYKNGDIVTYSGKYYECRMGHFSLDGWQPPNVPALWLEVDAPDPDPQPENTAPVLSGVKNQTITVGDSFNALAGVTASDKEDGSLTAAIQVSGTVDTSKAGSYTLTYSVADSKGAAATASAVITVKAKEEPQNTAPVLSGVKDQTITVGDSFNALAGVTASDKEDGSLTAAIQVSGTVDTSKAGSYTLTYSVTDSKGATATAKAVVTVKGKDDPQPENTAPVLSGVKDQTITVGDSFNALAGVTASDKEDGSLTAAIQVSGTVNTAKAGSYTLTYSVTDSKGVTATAKAVITVKEKETEPSGDTYDATKIYVAGDTVVYQGKTYLCKWWTVGQAPGTANGPWELQGSTNPDGSKEYVAGQAYQSGDLVSYQGDTYKANWWTTSLPGSDSSWTAVSSQDPEENPDANPGTQDFKVVGYYPSWEPDKIGTIQYQNLTHINYAFAIPTADGGLLPLENADAAKKIIETAHKNGVKVLIAIGGWSYQDIPLENTFVSATSTDEKVKKFGDAIIAMMNQYGFDGVDMDWEHPRKDGTWKQYESLMLYLSGKLRPEGKLLTSAVLSGVTSDGNVYYDSAAHTDKVIACVDWFNVMAYDGGDGDRHSSYNFAVNCANYWVKTRNMPANKVVLGVPFYGRPTWKTYAEILEIDPDAYGRDTAVVEGKTAYYNGIPTIQKKTQFACDNLGGIMIWEISQDTTDMSKSLLNAIGDTARANHKLAGAVQQLAA